MLDQSDGSDRFSVYTDNEPDFELDYATVRLGRDHVGAPRFLFQVCINYTV